MDKNKVNVPKIRFPGFTDPWEQRKYSDTFTNIPNNTLARAELNYNSGLAKNVHYGDVLIKFGELLNVEKDEIPYITDSALVNKFRSSKLQNGDVIIADAAEDETVGKCTELVNVGEEIVISGLHTIPCRPTLSFASGYLGYFMNSSAYHTQLLRLIQGTKVSSISKSALQDTVIFHPFDIVEQKKISELFQQLNNLITLHQRKLNHLQDKKKSLLQKMFPKNGEDFPELRFPGFTDAWEQRKLGELSDVYDGTHQTPNYTDSGVMFLSVENIKTLQSEKYISEEDFEKEFKIFPEEGDVLMTRIGDIGTANVVESNEPKAYYVSLALLKHKKLDPYFLKESISSETVKKELWHRTLHIAFPKKINKNEIANVSIPYPKSEEEQHQIGVFFQQLDKLITLHQRKLNHLQEQKKSLLQQMFV